MSTRPGRPARATGAAGDLRQELEGALLGAEVRQRQRGVGAQDADEGDAGEVVALGHHLGADQDVDLAARDPGQHRLGAGAGGDVAIEAGDASLGPALGHRQGDALGPQPVALDAAAGGARRAGLGDAVGEVAVVTDQAIGRAVVGHRHRAVPAAERVAAGLAHHEGREAAAVEEQDRLLAGSQGLVDGAGQRRRQHALAVGQPAPEVDDLDRRQRGARGAAGHDQEPEAAGAGGGVGLEARGGRAQDGDGAGALGADQGDVAAVVAHALVLLERAVVLLVDDDHPQVGDRREHRRARAEGDAGLAPGQTLPLAQALPLVEAGVEDRDLVAAGGRGSERRAGA
ncbi:MAG: hypothetical protein HS111_27850 [Kofleriaceae bacterium]|nr:hypothetical protein [Kofleriaceae bacterium]